MPINTLRNIVLISLGLTLLLGPAVAPLQAQGLRDAFGTSDNSTEDPLDSAAHTAGYDVSEADTQLERTVGAIIQAVLGLLGVIFLILIIYGGILWMTAGGNEDQVAKARKVLTSATIGLIIVLSAYAISYFVIEALTEGTLESSGSSV